VAEDYVLTERDARGLMLIRASQTAMAEFAVKLGSDSAAQDLQNQVRWLDEFMDRIGATEMLVRRAAEASAYTIDTSRSEEDAVPPEKRGTTGT
jgi:hypothetical protein